MKLPSLLALLTLTSSFAFGTETVFTFDRPSDALALEERVSGSPVTIYVPSATGGLNNSGSLQWQTGNRVASRTPTSLRVDGSRKLSLSLAFLVSAAEEGGGQPLALGVRASAAGSPEFGRNATSENFGFRLGLQGTANPGHYRLLLANLPVGAGQQTPGQTFGLEAGHWYRLEVESIPSGAHQIDLVGRLVSLNSIGSQIKVLDEITLKGVANSDLLAHTDLVPWFGGQSGALRGIGTVDNFTIATR